MSGLPSLHVPPGFLAGGLLLWGLLAGEWMWAALLAAGLESRALFKARLQLAERDFVLVMDLCLLLLAGSLTYLFFTPHTLSIGRQLLLWSPLLLAPLALVHAWSTAGSVPLGHLFHTLSRSPRRARPALDLTLAYGLLCLLAAGGANAPGPWYFPGMACCLGLLLWRNRPSRHAAWSFALAFCLALGLAHVGQHGLVQAQTHARGWKQRFEQDPYRTRTGLGDVERVKQSQRILLRVAVPAAEARQPRLLLETAYDFFAASTWQATGTMLEELPSAGRPGAYRLAASPGLLPTPDTTVTVYQYFPRARSLLALPLETVIVDGVTAERVTGNALATVQVENVPGMLGYAATLDRKKNRLRLPGILDSLVSPAEIPALDTALARFGLTSARDLPPVARIGRLLQQFQTEFRYALDITRSRLDLRPLEEFLLVRKTGHCEIFATAGVLLLRRLGIPARYATGYSVQEWDEAAGLFVVRERHAHAWVLAWVDGRWQELDPTPAAWLEEETAALPAWRRQVQEILDWCSSLFFDFSRWRWLSQTQTTRHGLLLAAAGLGGFLLVRIWQRARSRQQPVQAVPVPAVRPPGLDSPFYAAIARLEALTGPRPPAEPLRDWILRLEQPSLLPLLALHYRERFDPQGLEPAERRRLAEGVVAWLALLSGKP